MRTLPVLALLVLTAFPALADERADAVDHLLPGTVIRLTTSAGQQEGHFVTNRADSLLLQTASQRMTLSYDDLQKIEVKESSIHRGMGVGAVVGAGVGAIIASVGNHDYLVPMFSCSLAGAIFGGLIGEAAHHWSRVYPAKHAAPPDTAAVRH